MTMHYQKGRYGFEYGNWNVEINSPTEGFLQNYEDDRAFMYVSEGESLTFFDATQGFKGAEVPNANVPKAIIQRIFTNTRRLQKEEGLA